MAKMKKAKGKIAQSPRRYDTKYLGDEPEYGGNDRMTRFARKAKSLYWYGYFFDAPMYKAWREKAVSLGYKPTEVKVMDLAPEWQIGNSAAPKLCEMETKGWVLDEEEIAFLRAWLDETLRLGTEAQKIQKAKAAENINKKSTASAPVSKLLLELDDLEDCWIRGEAPAFELFNRAKANGESKSVVAITIRNWVQRRLDDLKLVKAGDKQAIEAFSHLSTREVTARIKHLESMISDIDLYCAAAPKTRKTRVVKEKPVDLVKMVARLQYLKSSKEFKLESIDPKAIIGAKKLYVFNTENRQLRMYTALPGGFTISGSSIRNYDENASRETRLRKPEEMLKTVLTQSEVKVLKAWEALKTKQYTPNGRIKETCVLLKVEK
jgi:hypothetical protein